MTNTAPLSSCTVTAGGECLLAFLVLTVLPEGTAAAAPAAGEDGPGSPDTAAADCGPCRAQSEAATAHWRRRVLAGRLPAWARRLPAGVVSMAAWMCGERLARRNAVTRFVRSSGGGGGMGMTRDILAALGGGDTTQLVSGGQ